MRCYVCQRETPPRQRYCDRCRLFFRAQTDKRKRRLALQEAYDKEADGFRCHYSGVLLEERDPDDPFHLCFDHLLPVRTSRLVVSSELFNHMKFELTEDEFHIAIQELAAHHADRPFHREAIGSGCWAGRAPCPPGPRRGERASPSSPECVVWAGPRAFDILPALPPVRAAPGPPRDEGGAGPGGFGCRCTGVVLDDPWSPWFLTFDHRVPGDAGTLVVAAWWVNAMKTALSEEELWKVVGEYDRYLREGGEFDRKVVGFEYWKRARGRRR